MKARDDTGRNGSNGIAAPLRDGDAIRARATASPVSDPAAAFDRLSRRHRECLRGVRALKGSKEIAEELGIEKSTVDSYLTEAVKLLGARNRRDAALRWAAYERLFQKRGTPIKSGVILRGYPRSLPIRHCRWCRTRPSSWQRTAAAPDLSGHRRSRSGCPSGGKDNGATT
jgi:DNA-binding CsgD family transcriptional regulator